MADDSSTKPIGPFAFAREFLFLWNTVAFITLMLVMFFSLYLFGFIDSKFPALFIGNSTPVVLLLIPLVNASFAFIITYYFFQRVYPQLAAAISSRLPTTISKRELWKSWALCYWFDPIALIAVLAIAPILRLYPTRGFLLVVAYPLWIFLTSLPVYLRLQYLARRLSK